MALLLPPPSLSPLCNKTRIRPQSTKKTKTQLEHQAQVIEKEEKEGREKKRKKGGGRGEKKRAL
jgi:hypothetical protein